MAELKLYQINKHTEILGKKCDCLEMYMWFASDKDADDYIKELNEEENTDKYFWDRDNINRELIR